ncbi:indole-3-glycerol phosphate synthase [Adhaeribacter aerolatus]|uniref:Indole-3-glycerol phosphate synthase n=1 Tax=Adhaeribacter aerolatus TaxID=670289 RepID=A0A512AYT8_9BACT|nr:indole-3-glycerol phosphate synthase TrpC [Adhaeribacter aerolatus]GEO04677.1 indole-3-glycerol phosphate synthase [Adhaeribacter aerolatus]
MNILEEIAAFKQTEVADRKSLVPVKLLEQSIYFETQPVSLKKYLQRPDLSGIIAEFKRKSPSLGMINPHAAVEKTTIGYMQAGASALSVLTDQKYFGGKSEDLTTARKYNFCPILRKDFIVDEYQIVEAKSIGADVILLIAGILETPKLNQLADFARSLGLEILLEVHDQEELERTLSDKVDVIGVNNRNLKDFTVSINTSKELAALIPDSFIKVSESGIGQPETIRELRQFRYQGFLMGEAFMKTSRPEKACADFIHALGQTAAV